MKHPVLIRNILVVVALFVAYAFLPLRGEYWWVGATIGLAMLIAILPMTIRRFRRILLSNQPLVEAMETLSLLVSMLLVGFAAVYYAMNRDGDEIAGLNTRIDSMYFTITTMSTVGYGDIHPTSQTARVVVSLNMIVNLTFIGIALKALMGAVQYRRKGEGLSS